MLVMGLMLALQVTVNVDRDSGRASAGISINAPSRQRLAVTDEHRRTAFRDANARDLILKARAARLEQDSSLQSYDVKSYQRMSVGMALRETARDRLMFRSENAAHVRWQRGIGARVEVLGARQVAPIVQGIDEAERDMEMELEKEIGDMLAVPYYPGKDELWLFDMVGSSDDDEGSTMLIHPVAEGSEAYFTFSSGDSVDIVLPDGKRIKLREVIATPREAVWNLVVGSFWFETEHAHLTRAVMRFSAPMDIWETVEAEDSTARDDMPAPVRAMLSPMRAEITAVTLEYGLFEQRYWLPRTQGAEGYARVSFMRVPFRIEQRYRYESVNATSNLEAIAAPPASPRWSDLRDSLRAIGMDSAVVGDTIDAIYARADTARRAARDSTCATNATYTVYERRENGALVMAVEVPCDIKALANSPDLPPSIFDSGDELFGAAQREELMQMLDFGLQPSWGPRPPTLEYGLQFTRFNRVEGLGSGLRLGSNLGKGYSVALDARGSIADLQLNGALSLSRSNGRRAYRGSLYRRLDVSSDFGDPLSFGASLPAFFYARDEGFYHRSWGAEFVNEGVPRRGLEWRMFAEQQWNARVENDWSLFGGANDVRFLGNVVADEGWFYGAGVRWRGSRGLDPQGWRLSADFRLEGATGAMDYGRAFLETIVSRGLGPLAASVTAAAGTSEGDLPAQRQFFLGGLQSVRGQNAGSGVGEAFWMTRVELGTDAVAVKPVIFGDFGWAGARDGWSRTGRPLSGVGVGASFLDGLFRMDLARGIYPRAQTRFDLYLEARF
jgi:hypothetical protein